MFQLIRCPTLAVIIFLVAVVSADIFSCFRNKPVRRKWPPTDPKTIADDEVGGYDVRINPYLARNAKYRNSLCSYVKHLKRKYRKYPKGTCAYQAAWILYRVRRSPYDYFPQPVSHFAVLKAVRKGRPVYEAPINDLPLTILKRPKTCERKHDFVLMVHSCPHCFSQRQRYRTIYLNPKLWRRIKFGYVFVTGIPARKAVQNFYFDGMIVRNVRNTPKGVTPNAIYAEMQVEASRYRDMLIGDFEHNIYSYSWGYILGVRWASVFCNKKVPLFGFIFGNFVLVPYKFSYWLKRFPNNRKRRLYAGHPYRNVRVNHNTRNRWGISWQDVPWSRYIPYVHEKLMLLGHDTVQEAAILSAWTKYFRIVQVYAAIVNRKLRIHPKNINGIFTQLRNRYNARHAILGDIRWANRLINWRTGKAK